MQIWLEIVGSFPERVGKYLICPLHSSTRKNFPMYKILEEPGSGDIVFHYILERVSGKPSAFTSYSRVEKSFYLVYSQDPLCHYAPPYRRVDLYGNTPLGEPITMEMLAPHRMQLETISAKTGFTRTPFDKNFRIKQLYLSRIPSGFLYIFTELSRTTFDSPK